jgi:hypothetical protein
MRATRARAAFAAGALALVGCAGLGGVRPNYGPVPGSVAFVVEAQPAAVTRAASEEVQHAGLQLLYSSAEEGYLETQWFSLVTRTSSLEPDLHDLERSIKVRFFCDPTAGKTRVVAEAVSSYAVDASRPGREMERMAPEGHPGREVLTQILDRLKRRYPTAARDTVRAVR